MEHSPYLLQPALTGMEQVIDHPVTKIIMEVVQLILQVKTGALTIAVYLLLHLKINQMELLTKPKGHHQMEGQIQLKVPIQPKVNQMEEGLKDPIRMEEACKVNQ